MNGEGRHRGSLLPQAQPATPVVAQDLRSDCRESTCSGGLYEVLLADGASRVMCTRHGLVEVH